MDGSVFRPNRPPDGVAAEPNTLLLVSLGAGEPNKLRAEAVGAAITGGVPNIPPLLGLPNILAAVGGVAAGLPNMDAAVGGAADVLPNKLPPP